MGAGRQAVLREADLRPVAMNGLRSRSRRCATCSPERWAWDNSTRQATRRRDRRRGSVHIWPSVCATRARRASRDRGWGSGRRCGSSSPRMRCQSLWGLLDERLVERLVAPDTTRQASACGVPDPGAAFHPWYPVLEIGGNKAELYKRALIADIVDKRRNLTDPCWLLQVGLYLEFLTFLGVAEAVRDDHGDLLTPSERLAFARSPWFAQIRDRINPTRWREVWKLHRIAFPARGVPRTGPASAATCLASDVRRWPFLRLTTTT